jgi:putative membrane protein
LSYLVGHWSLGAFVFVAVALVAAHEAGLARLRRRSRPLAARRRRLRSIAFYSGLAVLVVGLDSPLDHWGYEYFFVHMIQHVLLMFIGPALLVAGAPWLPLLFAIPLGPRRRLLRFACIGPGRRAVRSLGRVVRNRWFCLLALNAVMIGWHVPAALDLGETNRFVHTVLMEGSFVVSGVLFWSQVLPSHPLRPRAAAVWQGGAVVATNVAMFVLAMAMSIFSTGSWYPVYDHVAGVRMAPFADQQIGAAILWVCGDFWAVPALIGIIRRAISEEGGIGDLVDRVLRRPETVDLT